MKKYLAVGIAACLSVAAAVPASASNGVMWGGYSGAPDSNFGYIGGVIAIDKNMHGGNLDHDSLLLRAGGGYGEFEYDRPGNPAGSVEDDMTHVDLMVGYQHFFAAQPNSIDSGRITFFVGGDYQNHDLSKVDRGNDVDGDEIGIKGQVELNLNFAKHFEFNGIASYASDFSTYWTRARVGYKFGQFTAGPEGLFQGNEAYDQQRIGGYASIPLTNAVSAEADLGYSEASRRGKDGMYGGVGFALKF